MRRNACGDRERSISKQNEHESPASSKPENCIVRGTALLVCSRFDLGVMDPRVQLGSHTNGAGRTIHGLFPCTLAGEVYDHADKHGFLCAVHCARRQELCSAGDSLESIEHPCSGGRLFVVLAGSVPDDVDPSLNTPLSVGASYAPHPPPFGSLRLHTPRTFVPTVHPAFDEMAVDHMEDIKA